MPTIELDEDQRRAIQTDGSTLVEAGAGAGKTRTLVAKAVQEIANGRNVYVMTFTVSAAEEIKRRLAEAKLKEFDLNRVGTLHSFCLGLLRWAGVRDELIDEAAHDIVASDIARQLRLKIGQKRMRLLMGGGEMETAQERAFVSAYQKTMREYGLMSYDGILRAALEILKSNVGWKKAIFLIDEAQDSSADDLAIYDALMSQGAVLWMVGDLQQAIFSFRHPIAVNVWEWWKRKEGSVCTLPRNYRSSEAVVKMLNVINQDFDPRLEAQATAGAAPGETTLFKSATEDGMLLQIRERIAGLQTKYGSGLNDFAVLCRTNRECEKVAGMLADRAFAVRQKNARLAERVPERLLAALGFFRQPGSDWMACRYLRSIGVDDKAEQKAATIAMQSVGQRIYPGLFETKRNKPADWPKWMEFLRVPKPEQAWFYERMPKEWTALTWDEITLCLFEAAVTEEHGDGVTVTTVHAAKGREWRHVLMPWCDQYSYRQKNGPEEGRVFFVGASRAIETLSFFFSETRVDEFKAGLISVAIYDLLRKGENREGKGREVTNTMIKPKKEEFTEYAESKGIDAERAGDQWDAWQAGDWRDGKGFAIVNWKLKLVTYAKQGYGMFGERKTRRSTDKWWLKAAREVEKMKRDDEQQQRKNI